MPLRMLLARTVGTGGSSALISKGDLALPPKPTEAAGWLEARFGVYVLNVALVSKSLSVSVS